MLKEINITLIIIHSILCGHTIESTILNMLWQVELITMVYYLYGYNNKIKIINYSIFYIFNCTTIIIVINGRRDRVLGNKNNTVIHDKAELERYERVRRREKIIRPGGRAKEFREYDL